MNAKQQKEGNSNDQNGNELNRKEKISETKNSFFAKIHQSDKRLTRLAKQKKRSPKS